MPIEIFNGSSWVNVSDPEVYDGSNFVNIQKGEVYDGSSWRTFYNRFSGTVNTPTLTLSSRTISTITVQVTLPTGSPYKTQVTVYRTTNALGASLIPSPAAVGAISGTKTETGLTHNTSYQFSAYASYYDSGGNLLAQSATVTQNFSTLDYTITTPTTPQNSARATTSLSFTSFSNANYVANGSYYTATPYVEFQLFQTSNNAFISIQTATLPLNDVLSQVSVTFSNLTSGVSYYCKARTYYYSPVSQYSSFSLNSASTTTSVATPAYTTLMASNNTTYLDFGTVTASSEYNSTYIASRASDGNNSTEWISAAQGGTTEVGPYNVSISYIVRSSSQITYAPISNFLGTPSRARTSGISSYPIGSDTNIAGDFYNLKYTTWNFTLLGTTTRYTWFAKTGSVPPTAGDTIRVRSVSTALNLDWVVDGKQTQVYGGSTHQVLSVLSPGKPLVGSTTNPINSANGYMLGLTINGGTSLTTLNRTTYQTVGAGTTNTLLKFNDTQGAFSQIDTDGSIDYYYSTSSSGAGNETLYVVFDPKESTYPSPRITTNNELSIRNGNQIRNISAKINGVSLGTLSFTAGQTRAFSIPQTINTQYDAFLNRNVFTVELTVPRISDVNAGGWVASIVETQISYTYTSFS